MILSKQTTARVSSAVYAAALAGLALVYALAILALAHDW
jgi:hypothetical protein